jgi:hypothetical protein
MPEPVPLRRMVGPGVILAGLSIGSGEFVLWPRLTADFGFAVFWACWIGVTLQLFLNLEIERYTLATGESAVTGFQRLWPGFGWILLACGTLPWIWPGWATGAATLVSWELGGSVPALAMAGLLACGAVLSLGPVVYRTVETLQMALVSVVFLLVVVLAARVVDGDSVRGLLAGAVRIGHVPEGIELPVLLGALAFAGAGGTTNLAQSNYVKDKGYGMGRYIGRITSPWTGRVEAESETGVVLAGSPGDLARWRTWWRRANQEHVLSFYLLCLVSLSLFCLLTHALLGEGGGAGAGFAFIGDQADALASRFGPGARHAFLWAGVAVLFSTELGILDAVTRVVVDLLKVHFLLDAERWTPSRLYFLVLWSLVGFGVAVLLAGLDQPLQLIVISASLNALVMFLYSGLLLWLGWRVFRPPLRPSLLRSGALLAAFAFFGYFSALTVWDRVWGQASG